MISAAEANRIYATAPPPSAVPSPSSMVGASSPTSPAAEATAPSPVWSGAHAQTAAGSSSAAPAETPAPPAPAAHALGAYNYDGYPTLPEDPMHRKNFRNAQAHHKFTRALGAAQRQLEATIKDSPIQKVVLATKMTSGVVKWTPLDYIEEAERIQCADPTPRTLEDASGVILRLMYDQHKKFDKEAEERGRENARLYRASQQARGRGRGRSGTPTPPVGSTPRPQSGRRVPTPPPPPSHSAPPSPPAVSKSSPSSPTASPSWGPWIPPPVAQPAVQPAVQPSVQQPAQPVAPPAPAQQPEPAPVQCPPSQQPSRPASPSPVPQPHFGPLSSSEPEDPPPVFGESERPPTPPPPGFSAPGAAIVVGGATLPAYLCSDGGLRPSYGEIPRKVRGATLCKGPAGGRDLHLLS